MYLTQVKQLHQRKRDWNSYKWWLWIKRKGKFKFVRDTGLPLTLVADSAQNVIKVYYEEPNITATKTNNSKGKKLVEGDKVEYIINVTNNGNVSGDATITDEIPKD